MTGHLPEIILAVTAAGTTLLAAAGWFLTTRQRVDGPRHAAIGGIVPLALPVGVTGLLAAGSTGQWLLGLLPLAVGVFWRAAGVRGWNAPRRWSQAQMPARRRRDGRSLTVTSVNLLVANERYEAVARKAASLAGDLLVTVETTPRMRDAIAERSDWMPVTTGTGDRGAMVTVWARPGVAVTRGPGLRLHSGTLPGVRVDISGRRVHVVGVHLAAPVTREATARWERECAELHDHARRGTRLALLGDFNASLAHPGLRRLQADLVDAAASNGRPLLRTWPARGIGRGRGLLLPIMNLDHILHDPALEVTGIRGERWPGTDHLSLTGVLTDTGSDASNGGSAPPRQ